jgi:hypothetical protein
VLTRAAAESTDNQDFEAQAGIERRQWLCVATQVDVDVCTAHLNERTASEAEQDPGLQHVYGSGGFRSPSAEVGARHAH